MDFEDYQGEYHGGYAFCGGERDKWCKQLLLPAVTRFRD